jgi:hypothetical protein
MGSSPWRRALASKETKMVLVLGAVMVADEEPVAAPENLPAEKIRPVVAPISVLRLRRNVPSSVDARESEPALGSREQMVLSSRSIPRAGRFALTLSQELEMRKISHRLAFGCGTLFVAVACGPLPHGPGGHGGRDSGESPDAGSPADAATGANDSSSSSDATDSGSTSEVDATSDAAPPVLDCSSQRRGNVNDACWSCLCGKCADRLNLCDDGCLSILSCSVDNNLLVGAPAELTCEGRSVLSTCLKDTAAQNAVTPFILFDGCLINAHQEPQERLRACEAECGIHYTDDVCQRFP